MKEKQKQKQHLHSLVLTLGHLYDLKEAYSRCSLEPIKVLDFNSCISNTNARINAEISRLESAGIKVTVFDLVVKY